MYAILISFALAIYTIILVDFSFLYKEISANNDLLTSTQVLYTAEGAVENAVRVIGDQDLTLTNLAFMKEAANRENTSKNDFLEYGTGIETSYLKRNLTLNHPSLNPSAMTPINSHDTVSGIYLSSPQTLDEYAYQSLEPKKAKGFVLREIAPENNFNEIHFDFNQKQEASELVLDIFAFPKEGNEIDFQDFETLKNNPESNSVKRISINTLDPATHGFGFKGGLPLKTEIRSSKGAYKRSLILSGFQPLENNYLLHFQTLDNHPTHFKLAAFYQGKPVVLPNFMQTLDLIGATSTGLYQRVKFQREAEEGIAPGLNFVHFSDEDLIK